ncbi:hypothetical protein B0J14DRAFT_565352 [Halenospora varia]|nr:hypothetical protein B0J14DRAFT_565352 [Halenospora varia]
MGLIYSTCWELELDTARLGTCSIFMVVVLTGHVDKDSGEMELLNETLGTDIGIETAPASVPASLSDHWRLAGDGKSMKIDVIFDAWHASTSFHRPNRLIEHHIFPFSNLDKNTPHLEDWDNGNTMLYY